MSQKRVILAPDDIEIGMFLTIYSRKRKRDKRLLHELSQALDIHSDESEEECSPNGGIPMRVIAIQFPYVICAVTMPSGKEDGPKILDLRQITLMRISEEYLAGILEFGAKHAAAKEDSDEEVCIDPRLVHTHFPPGFPGVPPGIDLGTLKIQISADDQEQSKPPAVKPEQQAHTDNEKDASEQQDASDTAGTGDTGDKGDTDGIDVATSQVHEHEKDRPDRTE